MKLYHRLIPIVVALFLVVGCSNDSAQTNGDNSNPVIENDIVGNWTQVGSNTGEIWQFFEDGTFIDTANVAYEYRIQKIDGIDYLAFDREGLNIELTEEDQEEMERAIGGSEFIPIYEARMSSKDSLILDPATILYGSDSYFNFTFVTLVLRRQ